MTRKSPRKPVEAHFWEGRLRQARAFLESAREAVLLAGPDQNCSPAASQVVLAAIAFGDALTARRAQIVNQQDHAAAPRLLREVLRDALPAAQERRYRRILGLKDEVHYGTRRVSLDEARRLLTDLEEFARWIDDSL